MMVCTGTGCQYRIPVIWTQPMLDRVAAEMGNTMASCDHQSAECELEGVERAMTIMEAQFREKLDRMTDSEIHAYMVTNAYHDPFLQDCVDQVYNGTAYLMILADAGLMKLFKTCYPGYMDAQLHSLASSQWLSDRTRSVSSEFRRWDWRFGYRRSRSSRRGHLAISRGLCWVAASSATRNAPLAANTDVRYG
jgi:hypothetical protein